MLSPRHQLDRRFGALKPLSDLAARPPSGWVRAIRQALGMTTTQLGTRLGIRQSSVVELERREMHETITLQNLRRAAEALGCRLVYVLIPDKPLDETVRGRAATLADQRLAAVDQTMKLESQEVPGDEDAARASLIEQLLRKPSRLWDRQ